ncbi:CatA-like O-acetyltransferase [Lacrimispora xylanolytica]|uniref:CatA-like O-acetyltransferase n=1 Tax=Lacrimispora xylanolytica TaxID=29375 RepID=A0ABY7ACT0_9FIRM|nr:CatA-like O-acetyltransferase [Lacrimispora xylanolytica]WAJ24376.1 CatA-like O-acetyltransferase [Lacrimispora xylanolytica]
MENNKFTPLDLQSWSRGQMFYYFTQMTLTGFSLTATLDITIMKKALEERQFKFFPAFVWAVTTILNQHMEFKIAIKEEMLGYWDTLTPLYPTFHEDNKTISQIWTPYSNVFKDFYSGYLDNEKEYGNHRGVLAQPVSSLPANCYSVSCLPWIDFQHFSLHSYENKPYYFPTIEGGKFTANGDKVSMPISISVHHATTDGWHVKCFLEELQALMNEPLTWLD